MIFQQARLVYFLNLTTLTLRQWGEALLTLKTTILNLQQAGFDNAKIAVLLGKTEEEITRLLS